ncbi:MAG TPA: TolC family protein, partial [Gemmatimonadaceae bacterium]|nr:TolC family protein [Gemmatimonadaceae bacterium]
MRLYLGLCALVACSTGASAVEAQRTDDSLHLSRRQAIAEALTRNASLEAGREQIAEARARRVTGLAVPDPALAANYDQVPGAFGESPAKPIGVGFDIPFPDKFRLNNRIGWADIHSTEANYHLQQQTIANQTSATYDSLLVAFMHRDNLREARDLAADFLKRTQ